MMLRSRRLESRSSGCDRERGTPERRVIIASLVQLDGAGAAASLSRLARAKAARRNDFVPVGIPYQRLFCLLVAKSIQSGVEPVETAESMCCFEAPIGAIMPDSVWLA